MRVRLTLSFLLALAVPLAGQDVPTPLSHFGFEVGSHRQLANWTELLAYYQKLALASPRISIDTLGLTTQGRPFVLLTITSAENHGRLAELREMQLKLADPRRITGPQERDRLLAEGRTVALITHSIHSTEVGGAQMAARLAYRLASSNDEKVREILDNVIFLDIPSLNPDGTEMVTEWYRRWVGTEFEAAPLPSLYHFYTGHDNNRDWYAFTQLETQHTVTKAHNAWHPHIVHDIHQMGSNGARIFFPPFVDPVEPNIDPALVSALNQLGAYQAAELNAQGKRGVVISAIYDAFTPARAYQHYHGGVRILSETASARLATPITLSREELSGRRGFDAHASSWNFPNPWEGGEWGLPDIVDYMEAGAMALLTNAARNRRFWLENFYAINQRAVNRWPTWPHAWIIPADQNNATGRDNLLWILRMGDVEIHRAQGSFTAAERAFAAGSYVIPMNQPYASFAQTMLERQDYPDRFQYPGGPPEQPYDVTAHTLPLLMNVDAVPVDHPIDVRLSDVIPLPTVSYRAPAGLTGGDAPRIAVYKSWQEPMPEGWTRWVLDKHRIPYDTLHDADIRNGALSGYDVLLLENQSAESIRNGWPRGVLPESYTGGLGPNGVEQLRRFVADGGRLVAIEEATDFAIRALDLGASNAVANLADDDFYIPGSILRVDVNTGEDLARGFRDETPVWFWRSSRAFDVSDGNARIVARYRAGDPLLSGWVLGGSHVAGKAALVELAVGRGSVVLFGFPPNYRGQSIATWPLLFNALQSVRTRPSTGER